MVDLRVVREYIFYLFKDIQITCPLDLENIIDDIIFLCFIVGNDFLPHLPGYSVRQAGVDLLIEFYRRNLNIMRGYLTIKCDVNLNVLQRFFILLSRSEYQLILKVKE